MRDTWRLGGISEAGPRPGSMLHTHAELHFLRTIRTENCDELWSVNDVKTARHSPHLLTSLSQHQDEESRGADGSQSMRCWDGGTRLYTRGPLCSAKTRPRPPLKPLSSVGCTHKRKMTGASPLSHRERAGNGAEIRTDLFSIWYVWDWDNGGAGVTCEARVSVKRSGDSRPHVRPTCPRPRIISTVSGSRWH